MIVAPPFVLPEGIAGGLRRLGGGAGAGLRCLGMGELGKDETRGAEWGTGRMLSGDWGISRAAGEKGV